MDLQNNNRPPDLIYDMDTARRNWIRRSTMQRNRYNQEHMDSNEDLVEESAEQTDDDEWEQVYVTEEDIEVESSSEERETP
jgi:hypothetical protein